MFCFQLHILLHLEFIDVYFLLDCSNVTANVIAVLSQSSGELCGPWASCFCYCDIRYLKTLKYWDRYVKKNSADPV